MMRCARGAAEDRSSRRAVVRSSGGKIVRDRSRISAPPGTAAAADTARAAAALGTNSRRAQTLLLSMGLKIQGGGAARNAGGRTVRSGSGLKQDLPKLVAQQGALDHLERLEQTEKVSVLARNPLHGLARRPLEQQAAPLAEPVPQQRLSGLSLAGVAEQQKLRRGARHA